MQDEGSFTMIARSRYEEIGEFMERLGMNLGIDHARRNQTCLSTTMEYVKLPANAGPAGT